VEAKKNVNITLGISKMDDILHQVEDEILQKAESSTEVA